MRPLHGDLSVVASNIDPGEKFHLTIMLFGVLAMSLGLLWGFAGLVSFGQAGFFALGAYTMGLAMKWGGGIDPAYLGLLLSLVIGGVLAAMVGYFLFSAGVRGAYFVLVTLALSIMLEQIAVSQSQITGGWNGMFIDRMSLSFGPLGKVSLFEDAAIYYFILPIVAVIYVILYTLTKTKFGKVLTGIRENEDRLISLGFDASLYKTAVFAISGAVACFAEGPTTIRNVAHIRHKETDRIGDLARELRKFGATVDELPD